MVGSESGDRGRGWRRRDAKPSLVSLRRHDRSLLHRGRPSTEGTFKLAPFKGFKCTLSLQGWRPALPLPAALVETQLLSPFELRELPRHLVRRSCTLQPPACLLSSKWLNAGITSGGAQYEDKTTGLRGMQDDTDDGTMRRRGRSEAGDGGRWGTQRWVMIRIDYVLAMRKSSGHGRVVEDCCTSTGTSNPAMSWSWRLPLMQHDSYCYCHVERRSSLMRKGGWVYL